MNFPATDFSPHRFCTAPMIDVSDKHWRYLARLLSRHALLYTDMITTHAILHGDQAKLLNYNGEEHQLALQLGGSDPAMMKAACEIAAPYGYDEFNLNCGCPSDRVLSGAFGASLMAEPELVRDLLRAMKVDETPVTLKCRTGIDQDDDFDKFLNFIDTATDSPCQTVIVHARNAWLKGLSPKENREVPPLKYDWAYRLKQMRPQLSIVLNGGIKTVAESLEHLQHVDGVMIGLDAWHYTYFLSEIDQGLFNDEHAVLDRVAISRQYADYCARQLAAGNKLNATAKHLLGLWHGVTGAKQARRHLSEQMHKKDAGIEVVYEAINLLEQATAGTSP